MSATASRVVPDVAEAARLRAAERLVRIAGDALPRELAQLAEGSLKYALAKAVDYAQRSVSPTIERIYADDWSAFRTWCVGHHAPYLPAAPAVVAAYLAERADTLSP